MWTALSKQIALPSLVVRGSPVQFSGTTCNALVLRHRECSDEQRSGTVQSVC